MPPQFLQKLVIESDARIADAYLRLVPAAPALLIFAFHSLFDSEQEVAQDLMDPQQAITTEMFRSFAVNLRDEGYRFVSPEQVVDGVNPSGKYAMISFDDGYANNLRALPILEELQVPAVFCISTNHVNMGKPFWWDVLYREGRKHGWSIRRLDRERIQCKLLRTCDAEKHVIAEFGISTFQTVSDIDRPLSSKELAQFAEHPLVHIGNHTSDHAILTNYSPSEAYEQIKSAQNDLHEITGRAPQVIAYPNGAVAGPTLRAARDAGLALGMTVQPGRNTIPGTSSGTHAFLLKRNTLWGSRDIAQQCRVARSPLSLRATLAAIRSNGTLTA